MAKYIMQEMADLNNEGKTLLYPRMMMTRCCETDELVEWAAKGTTFNTGEVKGAITLLAEGLARMMAQGRSVRIEGIGLFTPSLSLKKGKEREEADGSGTHRNANSIEVGSVNFRPDKELMLELNGQCELERQPGRFRCKVSKYTPEQRLALAQTYLNTHSILRIEEYASMTGLNRCTAGKELRKWGATAGSGIMPEGRGAHRIYVRREETGQSIV